MRDTLKKYRNLLLILLVITVNSNYAVTVGLCAMGMDHNDKCCCTHSTPGNENKETAYTKPDCCAEVTTEFSNKADFESVKRLEVNEIVSLFPLNVFEDHFGKEFSKSIYVPHRIEFPPGEDIPIKHSSLLI